MFEITSDGNSQYKEMSLRELLKYVNGEASRIDELAAERDAKHAREHAENMTSQSGNAKGTSYEHDNTFDVDVEDKNLRADSIYGNDLFSSKSSFEGEDGATGAATELRLRDLRRLDYQFNPNEEKTILIRRHVVLFAMDPMRAVVMADRLILIVPPGADTLLTILDKHMKEWKAEDDEEKEEAKEGDLHHNHKHHHRSVSFESHAYEALLTTVHSLESQEFTRMSTVVKTLMRQCGRATMLPIAVQETMRDVKNDLTLMRNRVNGSRHALHELTEDDEEMCLMHLTCLKRRPDLYSYPLTNEILARHEDMDELLECYVLDFNSLATKIAYCSSQIENAEDLVSLRLDTSRNELLIANTALTVLACSIAFSAYLTGVFGMNLDNTETLQSVRGLFLGVTGGTLVLIPMVYCAVCRYLRYSRLIPGGLLLTLHGSYDEKEQDEVEK